MIKKTFALLIAFCVATAPLSANETEINTTYQSAYEKGSKDGAFKAISGAMAALGFYLLATAKNGLYIPEHILKQTGTRQALRAKPCGIDYGTKSRFTASQYEFVTEPVYTTCDNELYTIMQDPSTYISNKGIQKSPSEYQDQDTGGFLQKFSNTPSLVAGGVFIASAAAVALYLYYTSEKQTSTSDTEQTA